MTPLAARLIRRIEAMGPMTVAEYMTECLLHPEHGYYTTRDPFGAAGDFTTAPEMSQMFGELIGLCLAQCWLDQGRPTPLTLAELGPGRGTLMADALRACAQVPGFLDAARITLVDASPVLRAAQETALKGHRIDWVPGAAALPEAPLFLIANEFFDALPIRQFLRDDGGWRERQVGVEDGGLAFGLSAVAPLGELADRDAETSRGDLVETCAPAKPIVAEISGRIAQFGGVALTIDYGHWRGLGDTLQALQGHKPDDPLAHPGEADLTAHVDFASLAQAAEGVSHTKLTPQGIFLERLGITARAQSLARSLSGDALTSHIAAHRRLTHPEEMGTLFKVLGLYPSAMSPPPGLEP